MSRIGIVIGSTRPGRKGETVARWVAQIAAELGTAEFEIVDVAEIGLPLFDEQLPPMAGQYSQPHTIAWAEKVASLDGFVFVTPEYNHSVPGALKNAIDFLFAEWNDKAAGFVSYGSSGGVRAVEHLRPILAGLKVATVASTVSLSLVTDFEDFSTFAPGNHQRPAVERMLGEVVAWAGAFEPLRASAASVAA